MLNDSDTIAIVGGPVEGFTAGLRVAGDDLDPDEISSLLEAQPTRAWRKGDVQRAGMNRQRYGSVLHGH